MRLLRWLAATWHAIRAGEYGTTPGEVYRRGHDEAEAAMRRRQ